jgi:hypothetical protein
MKKLFIFVRMKRRLLRMQRYFIARENLVKVTGWFKVAWIFKHWNRNVRIGKIENNIMQIPVDNPFILCYPTEGLKPLPKTAGLEYKFQLTQCACRGM